CGHRQKRSLAESTYRQFPPKIAHNPLPERLFPAASLSGAGIALQTYDEASVLWSVLWYELPGVQGCVAGEAAHEAGAVTVYHRACRRQWQYWRRCGLLEPQSREMSVLHRACLTRRWSPCFLCSMLWLAGEPHCTY